MNQVVWGAAVMLSVCVVSSAFAQAETPGIDQRQGNQEKRIDQGIASGQLTQRCSNKCKFLYGLSRQALVTETAIDLRPSLLQDSRLPGRHPACRSNRCHIDTGDLIHNFSVDQGRSLHLSSRRSFIPPSK